MRHFLSLLFLLSSTFVQAQSSEMALQAPRELYEGILALTCLDDEPNGDLDETLIITETNGKFQIVNAPNIVSVTKIKNGFVLKSSTDEEFLGFIKNNNGKWTIEFLSARGIVQGTCVEETQLVQNIITIIAPKVFENANSLAAAADKLWANLKNSEVTISSLTSQLNDQRKKAEETLALLAAAQSIEKTLDEKLATALLALEAARLAQARSQDELEAVSGSDLATVLADLREAKAISTEAQSKMALLSQEVRELRAQIGGLQATLNDYKRRDADNNVKITNLGSELNVALARIAAEAKRNLVLEADLSQIELEKVAMEAAIYKLRSDLEQSEMAISSLTLELNDERKNTE